MYARTNIVTLYVCLQRHDRVSDQVNLLRKSMGALLTYKEVETIKSQVDEELQDNEKLGYSRFGILCSVIESRLGSGKLIACHDWVAKQANTFLPKKKAKAIKSVGKFQNLIKHREGWLNSAIAINKQIHANYNKVKRNK